MLQEVRQIFSPVNKHTYYLTVWVSDHSPQILYVLLWCPGGEVTQLWAGHLAVVPTLIGIAGGQHHHLPDPSSLTPGCQLRQEVTSLSLWIMLTVRRLSHQHVHTTHIPNAIFSNDVQ